MYFRQQLLFNTTEPDIFAAGVASTPREPFWFLGAIEKTKVASKNLSALGSIAEFATQDVAQNLNLSPRDVTFGLTKVSPERSQQKTSCSAMFRFRLENKSDVIFSRWTSNVHSWI